MVEKSWSEACERNRGPILNVLRVAYSGATQVLEIASGTGQHAVFFAAALPHLIWQSSDLAGNLSGIAAWCDEAGLPNLRPPLELDVDSEAWRVADVDGLFSANALHIMSWASVENFFRGVGRVLLPGGVLVVYGPFSYDGRHTAESNASFNAFLRAHDSLSGIRDFGSVDMLARQQGLALVADHAMPAHNRALVWRRERLPVGKAAGIKH